MANPEIRLVPKDLYYHEVAYVRGLEAALQALADAADGVGVRFFDTDTMEPEVEAMQSATQSARALLQAKRLPNLTIT